MKQYRVFVNGQSYDVGVEEIGSTAPVSQVNYASAPTAPSVPVNPQPIKAQASESPVQATSASVPAGPISSTVKAPMPGTITAIKVTVGQTVNRGDVLVVLEAMKMENDIVAPSTGVVACIRVQSGASVKTGEALVDFA